MARSAAALLAETLDTHGVDLIYCVPGESYLAAMGRSFGALGLTIDNDGDVERVVEQAMTTDQPVVVDVRASLNYLTAWRKLDEMPAYATARA
ncbi:MAG: hypothetical protein HY060_08340 [Proteobacteria bacterium]|nr:hypothetical protein [Pseudomonadota bacterium]